MRWGLDLIGNFQIDFEREPFPDQTVRAQGDVVSDAMFF